MSKTDIVARLQLLLSSDWNLTYIYNSIFSLNNKKKIIIQKTKRLTELFWLTTYMYMYTENYQNSNCEHFFKVKNMLAWKILIGTN